MKKVVKNIVIGILGATACMSCQDCLLYSQHKSIEGAIWENNDTLTYELPPVDESGIYEVSVSMRVMEVFDYEKVSFVIMRERDSVCVSADTACMTLFRDDGRPMGKGFPYIYNEQVVDTVKLEKDKRYSYKLWHVMRENSLYGISDVGVTVKIKN